MTSEEFRAARSRDRNQSQRRVTWKERCRHDRGTAKSRAPNSFVLLQIGNRRFALPARIVSELAPPVRLHTFPHTSPSRCWCDRAPRPHRSGLRRRADSCWAEVSSVHRFYLIARPQASARRRGTGAIPVNGECELATRRNAAASDGSPRLFRGHACRRWRINRSAEFRCAC